MRTLADALARNARVTPTAPCLSDDSRRLTFAATDLEVNRVCHALLTAGYRSGDTVALCARNSIECLLLLHAASRIGLHLVTLNYWLRGAELAQLLRHCQASLLVCDTNTVAALAEVVDTLSDPDRVQVVVIRSRSEPVTRNGVPTAAIEWSTFVGAASTAAPGLPVSDASSLWTMYTSGTTGEPKGAVRSQRRVMECVLYGIVEFGFTPGDRFLAVAPFFHGVTFLPLMVLVRGGSVHVVPQFDPEEAVQVLLNEPITATFLVPTMLTSLLDAAALRGCPKTDLCALVTGGASVPATLKERTSRVFGPVLHEFYGSTESGFVTVLHPHDQPQDGSSCGRACFGAQVEIRGEDDAVLPVNAVGELFSRCDGRFDGYLHQPEQTAEVLRDGWFTAGDLAYQDSSGLVHLVDRKKDLIISGGENVHPRDVEECLLRHAAVAECAVVGIPDPVWGEAVQAFVVLGPDGEPTADELIDHCSQHLAGFKRPRQVTFTDALPRNATGKVVKDSLRLHQSP